MIQLDFCAHRFFFTYMFIYNHRSVHIPERLPWFTLRMMDGLLGCLWPPPAPLLCVCACVYEVLSCIHMFLWASVIIEEAVYTSGLGGSKWSFLCKVLGSLQRVNNESVPMDEHAWTCAATS